MSFVLCVCVQSTRKKAESAVRESDAAIREIFTKTKAGAAGDGSK